MYQKINRFVLVLLGVNIGFFILNALLNQLGTINLVNMFLVHRVLVFDFNEYYRIVSAGFMHADIMHLASNMYSLYYLSKVILYFMDERQFITLYMVSLISSSFAIILFTNTAAIGASGAIYGLLGALTFVAIISHKHGRSELLQSLLPMIALNLLISFMPGISFAGHIGGFIAGFIFMFVKYFINKEKKNEKS